MKKIFLYSILLSLWTAGNFAHAQQWQRYNPTAWFDVNAVEIPGPGIITIGGGQESHDSIQVMFQSSDYGNTWYENAHDGYAPWNKSIAFSDSMNGCAVGYDGRIIKSDDAGRNWGHNVYPVNRDFNKIFYAGSGIYYIAGGNKTNDSLQTILKSSDYGNTWNVIYDTPGPWLKSIFFLNPLKGFAIGDNGVILTTINGGSSWTALTPPVIRDFNAMTFINANAGYIVGGNSTGQRTILKTNDGGTSWTVIKDETGGMLNDISFADTDQGYITGDSATVLTTTDGGYNWSPIVIDTSLTGNKTFNAVKFYNKNFGVLGGKNGILYIYLDLPVDVFTLGTSQIGTNDATLLGGINTHTKDARYSFVYADNLSFTSHLNTAEVDVQNDSLLMISQNIQGLTPNTVYYYFIMATTATDTIYGDTLNFSTGISFSSFFQTTDATGVMSWRANLNGFINKFREPVSLFFEYGTQMTFGSQIPASPSALNDTLMHNVQATVNGLQAYNQYFFRLKGVAASGTYYGDTKMFYAVNLPLVNTGTPEINSLTSAQLNGYVGNNGSPTSIKFEYGQTVQYGTEVNAVPDSVFGTNNISPTFLLTGLIPGRIYHFRLKSHNATGTSYGEDIAFCTSRPIVFTNPATNISLISAMLNGVVLPRGFPTTIKFEYGLTNSYGTVINAVPDSANDINVVSASYLLTDLSPATTYHYRISATNSDGTTYGSDITFITGGPTASTLPASVISDNSAQLNGLVNANNFPAVNKFEYGTTPAYGNEVTAIPDTLTGSNNESISFSLSGLLSNTVYYYRAKSTNANGTSYGFNMTFKTGTFPKMFTFPATDISLNSARLNGFVDAGGMNTAVKFEYGTTTLYGNEINAVPDSTSSYGIISASATPSNLISSTLYHYRIKGVNNDGMNSGNDMQFYTGYPEIPNFDFEMWDQRNIDFPDGWTEAQGNILQYSPGCSGDYAIKIQNTHGESIGFISIGTIGQGIYGGVPFNARPDSLIGCFKYNIDANDTSWIVLLLKKDGIQISMNIYKIVGNSGGDYVSLKFPIQYDSDAIPDSLILILSSSDLNQKTALPYSWLIADNLHFTGTSLNIPNNNLEQWHIENNLKLSGWSYSGCDLFPQTILNTAGISRSTDAVSNQFAVRLKSHITPNEITYGKITSGNETNYRFPVIARHQSLTGYYKFYPFDNDTMTVMITMYRNGSEIGKGFYYQNELANNYTPFNANINYYSPTEIPDSASITVQNFNIFPPFGNSVLYLDNLNFDGFLSAIKETPLPAESNINFNVYPNPFNDKATVAFTLNNDENVTVQLFDLSGKQVALLASGYFKSGRNNINLPASGFDKGFYICVINTRSSNLSKKIIIY